MKLHTQDKSLIKFHYNTEESLDIRPKENRLLSLKYAVLGQINKLLCNREIFISAGK
jgi:hypothetical protein